MESNLNEQDKVTTEAEKLGEGTNAWQLNALTEALGDLTLTISDSLSVGRGSDNDVVLGSKQVSRNHALLSVLNDKLYIKDLNSSNGTFINEQRIESNQSKQLQAKDTVGFADFNFSVTAATVATNVEQPVTAVEPDSTVEANYVDTTINTDLATQNTKTADHAIVEETEAVEPVVIDSPPVVTTTPEDTAAVVTPVSAQHVDSVESKADMNEKVNEVDAKETAKPATNSPVEPVVIEETVIDDVVLKEIVLDEIVLEHDVAADTIDEPVAKNTTVDNQSEHTDEPVVKETTIPEVLSSTESSADTPVAAAASPMPTEQETVMANDNSEDLPAKEPIIKEPVVNKPVAPEPEIDIPVTDEPLMEAKASHQEPVVTPEHDKTTRTALQEEADPDVLRAKQAATSQFSGTANLGQDRDLGTEGNNAMDQAIENPANAGQVEKKPSGSWFIWVFIAIIIVGLALWLFNMGGA